MIEYVTKNKGEALLPKNVRQVGNVDLDKKVYIEDYAFSFVKELVPDEDEEGRVGILLGEERTIGGDTYVFVHGAMEITNASIYDGRVTFTEETWPSVNANKNRNFAGMDTVGWFLVSSSIRPEKNIALERTHIDSFGRYKLLLYVNPAEQTDDMYSCFDGGLEALDGYMIYFDKNEEMQIYMTSNRGAGKSTRADDRAAKRYRQSLKESGSEPKAHRQLSVMYALSAILVILVLVIGVGKLQSDSAISESDTVESHSGSQLEETAAVNATLAALEDETLNVDYANGNVTTTQEETTVIETEPESELPSETTPETEPETQEETTAAETQPETTAEPEHRTYVIQQGDTLYDILMREYGSLDKLQELFDLNGITDGGNSINVGDKLLLP